MLSRLPLANFGESMGKAWKNGRGKLGLLEPLLGRWSATADSPMGPVSCTRVFERVLAGRFVRLEAQWKFGAAAAGALAESSDSPVTNGGAYEEIALFGAGEDGRVAFWSFTADGKRSQGCVADVTDLHPDAVGFEAHMPAGLARMAYWPDGESGFVFVVEARRTKGWKRFVEHRYRRVGVVPAATGTAASSGAAGRQVRAPRAAALASGDSRPEPRSRTGTRRSG
jgi:hypothetical protein